MTKFALLLILPLYLSPVFALEIVTTIKPLHSLVQSLVGDSATTTLLLDDNASPHDVQLRPSDIRTINRANVVFMIDRSFEGFMKPVIKSAPADLMVVEIGRNDTLMRLPPRSRGSHTHSDDHHGHVDPHMWLNPENAKSMARVIAAKLTQLDDSNSSLYLDNLNKTLERLRELDDSLSKQLKGLKAPAYITQHDAYQYFDQHYGLNFITSIALDSSIAPSVKLALDIRNSIQSYDVKCIFHEPQFSDRLVRTIAEDAGINTGILDPIGVDLMPGPELYFELMKNLADNFAKCLTQKT